MPKDAWLVPMRELMMASAETRSAHYREQATQLREMGERESDEKFRDEMLDLADKYDLLADRIGGSR